MDVLRCSAICRCLALRPCNHEHTPDPSLAHARSTRRPRHLEGPAARSPPHAVITRRYAFLPGPLSTRTRHPLRLGPLGQSSLPVQRMRIRLPVPAPPHLRRSPLPRVPPQGCRLHLCLSWPGMQGADSFCALNKTKAITFRALQQPLRSYNL